MAPKSFGLSYTTIILGSVEFYNRGPWHRTTTDHEQCQVSRVQTSNKFVLFDFFAAVDWSNFQLAERCGALKTSERPTQVKPAISHPTTSSHIVDQRTTNL